MFKGMTAAQVAGEVAVLIASLAAPIVAYKIMGADAAGVAAAAGMILNFFLGRGQKSLEPQPPAAQ